MELVELESTVLCAVVDEGRLAKGLPDTLKLYGRQGRTLGAREHLLYHSGGTTLPVFWRCTPAMSVSSVTLGTNVDLDDRYE